MTKLTATLFDVAGTVLSVTEHDTLTEALNEFTGWAKQGATGYMVQGSMTVDCVCKRTMESRNREIELRMTLSFNGDDRHSEYVAVKAPQACKYLSTVLGGAANAEVNVTITEALFRIG